MHIRAGKKLQNEVSLNECLGHDSDGNEITFMDILTDCDEEVADRADLNIDINVSLPLLRQKKIKQSDILKFIDKYADIPKSSILFGLTGVHSHWTTADSVRNKSILLLDSSYLKRLPLRNFPTKHQISKNDVFLIKAKAV